VNGAFDELGLRYNGAALSASRSAGIERQGISLDVKTLKRLAVVHDGKTTPVNATALTVGDALKQANIQVDNDDLVSPKLTTALVDGTKVTIKRVSTVTRKVDVKVPYKKVEKDDDSLFEDQSKTEREGVNGLKRQVVRITYVDGKQTKTVLVSEDVVRKAIDKITRVGTKERPEENGGGGNVGGGVDGLNWAALADCESGGNPRAVNPNGHYGLYQFSLRTWRSVGGSGNPIDNSAGEQTYRAKLLYKKAGAGQWSCGHHLFD
jgi:resuscitation-promoting factor RpfB